MQTETDTGMRTRWTSSPTWSRRSETRRRSTQPAYYQPDRRRLPDRRTWSTSTHRTANP